MSWGALLGGVGGSLVSGLFGGGNKPVNPYADQLQSEADNLAAIRSQQGIAQTQAQSGANEFDPQYRQAVTSEANLLSTNPYTDQYSTQVLGANTKNVAGDYDAAMAHTGADLARRGLSGGGMEAGDDASIESARAGTIAGEQNNIAQQSIASQGARAAALTGLLGGVAGGYQKEAAGDLGAEAGTTGDITGIYSGLNSAANAANEQSNAQAKSAESSFGTGLGGLIGSSIDGGGGSDPYSDASDPNGTALTQDVMTSGYDNTLPSPSTGVYSGDDSAPAASRAVNLSGGTTSAAKVNPYNAFLASISPRRSGLGA